MDEVEKYSRRRRRLLVAMGIAFLLWQLPTLEIVNEFAGGNRRAVYLVSIFAFFFWGGALILLMWKRGMKGASVGTQVALEDELVRANRARAFANGYWVMLVASGAAFALALFYPLPAHDVAQLILVAGVVTPMFTFAWLEGRGG